MFTKIFEKYGLKFHFINMEDANEISKYINENTKLIWTETPTNPMMNITDIAAVAAIVKNKNICFALIILLPRLICKTPWIWELILFCILLQNISAAK